MALCQFFGDDDKTAIALLGLGCDRGFREETKFYNGGDGGSDDSDN
jgi:hypothetical protein